MGGYRKGDPITSKEAYLSVLPNITANQIMVARVFERHPEGLCDTQLIERLQLSKISTSGARTRRNELTRAGVLVDTGRKDRTRGRRRTIVWVHNRFEHWPITAPAHLSEVTAKLANGGHLSSEERDACQVYAMGKSTEAEVMGIMKALLAKAQAGKLTAEERRFAEASANARTLGHAEARQIIEVADHGVEEQIEFDFGPDEDEGSDEPFVLEEIE